MLTELLLMLSVAETPQEIEKAYKNLERVGVDRVTARVLQRDMKESAS